MSFNLFSFGFNFTSILFEVSWFSVRNLQKLMLIASMCTTLKIFSMMFIFQCPMYFRAQLTDHWINLNALFATTLIDVTNVIFLSLLFFHSKLINCIFYFQVWFGAVRVTYEVLISFINNYTISWNFNVMNT